MCAELPSQDVSVRSFCMNKVRVFLAAVLMLPTALLFACSGESLPLLTSSSAFVDFGEVAVGESVEAQVTLSNLGTAGAELPEPTITGAEAAAFALVSADWPLSVEAGGSADITLSFTPVEAGTFAAALELSSTLAGALSGGAGAVLAESGGLAITLVGHGLAGGDDDDSAGDDDDTTGDDDDDTTGDDDDTAGDDDDSAGDDDDTSSDDDDTSSDDDDTTGDDDDAGAGPDEDGDGHVAESAGGTDCDDTDPTVNPTSYEICDEIDNDCDGDIDGDPIDGSVWHLDADSDGYGGQLLTQEACTAPVSYVANTDDCDDLDGAVYPGATELCNGIDDDCDGDIDDDAPAAQTWYLDNDGDGVGGFWLTQLACSMPQGYAGDSSDCDDTNAAIYPLATELCDGFDNDCDGSLGGDEIDDDGDGVTECSQDCDDADPLRFPGSAELCDGIDNDCDATTTAVGGEIDADSDTSLSCLDCDDDPVTGSGIYPGAAEVCNGSDDDCDGTVDVGATDQSTWYLDADGDGAGGGWLTQVACAAPTGYVATSDDCNDLDPTSYPGGTELCDGQDNDCNGQVDDGSGAAGSTWYADGDADGYGDPGSVSTACSQPTGFVSNSLDCDDGNAATNPTSYEICDGVDNNCVGGIDEAGALNATNWYVDADADGYGVPGTPVSACLQPNGYADNSADCNDDPSNGGTDINPDASEICNSVDDDCDGTADDGAVDATVWYVDADGDGYGNASLGTVSCAQLGGTVQDATDCDDTEAAINSAAIDVCDSIDNNCDNTIDETGESLGTASACVALDCLDIRDNRTDNPGDGLYWINPDGGASFEAYCEMTSGGGGWTLVMNIAPTDGNSVGYANDAFWATNSEYGSIGQALSNDYKGPAAYRLTGTTVMIQSADTGSAGTLLGWRRWPFGTSRTWDSLFGGGLPGGHNASCKTNSSDASDPGSSSIWDEILRQGSCLYTDINTGQHSDRIRLTTIHQNGADDKLSGFGACINCGSHWNGNPPNMGADRAPCDSSLCHYHVSCRMPGVDCVGTYCTNNTYFNSAPACPSAWNSRIYVR
jgi:hypothetical protein